MFVKYPHHKRLVNFVQSTVRHRNSRCHAQRLPCEASVAEELSCIQSGDNRFFALRGYDRELHLAPSKVEYGIRRLPLRENVTFLAAFYYRLPAKDAIQQCLPIDRWYFINHYNNILSRLRYGKGKDSSTPVI